MTTVENETNEDVAARLAAAEATIARLQARDAAIHGYQVPAPPKPSAYATTLAEVADRARQERVRVAEEAAEEARKQAIRDAPKVAKRDQELAAFDARTAELHAQRHAIQAEIQEVGLARQAVVNRYAMELNPPAPPIERKVYGMDAVITAMDRSRRHERV